MVVRSIVPWRLGASLEVPSVYALFPLVGTVWTVFLASTSLACVKIQQRSVKLTHVKLLTVAHAHICLRDASQLSAASWHSNTSDSRSRLAGPFYAAETKWYQKPRWLGNVLSYVHQTEILPKQWACRVSRNLAVWSFPDMNDLIRNKWETSVDF